MKIERTFPDTRMRRIRKSSGLREMLAETNLSKSDLIQPIFIKEDLSGNEAIKTMPGINRIGLDILIDEIGKIVELGIKSVAVFPVINEEKKDEIGSQATIEDNFICQAISSIKKSFPELLIIADVALDPYTDHGHDGLLDETGDVDNDLTLPVLREQAIVLAKAGTDMIAPSDMMDGRIKIIRDALEQNDFINTLILAYSAKFSSKFYGPFKDAVESAKFFGNKTKDTYQMPVGNINEALHEVALDIQEGADIVMVKPGMPYLDVIKAVKDEFKVPTFAYQVSGEYSMLKHAVDSGLLNNDVIKESLLSFKRAGADCVLTYFASEIARELS
ncbi:MAG: porphobilinogen synthase [Rhodobiaceae bacterium]|jgi:porphobilinogen synthase|nr:porphobilinogen synthase [Rhodobiaceae bacterium]